jgi:pimeloyl-ACP methyl ester carboxylesterase
MMNGTRGLVIGEGGVRIGTLTAGLSGPPLLLVHGGFGQIERWAPLWDAVTRFFRVTAMDRRGRGSSGDSPDYRIDQEYGDIAAVAAAVGVAAGAPVNIFAHSYGATCALGAGGFKGEVGRMVLYEPPGPQTVPGEWVRRATALVDAGMAGAAMMSFLTEVIGLGPDEVDALRRAPMTYDILAVVSATLPREAQALTEVDPAGLARNLGCPVTLLLGDRSPIWAGAITAAVAAIAASADIVVLPGVGHEAIDVAPDLVVSQLRTLLAS